MFTENIQTDRPYKIVKIQTELLKGAVWPMTALFTFLPSCYSAFAGTAMNILNF